MNTKHRPRSRVALLVICIFVAASCQSKRDSKSEAAAGADQQTPPAAVTQASWAPDALEELLAPIALYPDQLIGQILAASVNSQEVLDGGNWLLQNQGLSGAQLDSAAQKAGFGPAMRALLQYPTVVDMMCQEIDWTRQLGAAFNSDQKSVLAAVQRLRMQAVDIGNLKSTPQQTVETKTEGNNVFVEVKPADPQVVYVPQYDPQAVYTEPPPQSAPASAEATTTTQEATTTQTEKDDDSVSKGTAIATGLIGFGVGVALGSALNNDDDYYPNWGYGGVYYGGRPFYPPAYVYRPAYGGAFQPAYGYRSPAGYRNGYNSGNNNLVVNNKNYYNRFSNNQNLRTGGERSPLASQPKLGETRPGGAKPGSAGNWKGQSTYAGGRRDVKSDAGARRSEPSAGTLPARSARADRDARAERSPSASPRPTTQPSRQHADRRTTSTSNQAPIRTADASRSVDASRPADASRSVDRGYGDSTRTASRQVNSTEQSPSNRRADRADRSASSHESAFAGAQTQSGGFQRSASARGNASVGSRQASHASAGSRQAPGSSGGARRR